MVINDFEQGSTLAVFGDLTPLLKLNMLLPFHPTWALALEMGANFLTGSQTISNQETDYLVASIYAIRVGSLGIAFNVGYIRLG